MKRKNRILLPLLAFIATIITPANAQLAQNTGSSPVARHKSGNTGLPLVQVKATAGNSDYFAIMLSGDGGWSKFDRGVCAQLAANGVPALGLNCLRYIRKAKTPEQMTTDLTRLIQLGEQEFGRQKVILIGYSCGANLVPFAYNRLGEDLKAKVQYLALLSPEDMADFEFHLYNRIYPNPAKEQPVKPELEKMRSKPTLFLYGEQEKHAWCSDLMEGVFCLRKLPGGHHFGQNTAGVAAAILAFKV